MSWTPFQFRLAGGINEEDPLFTQSPGGARFARNYACLQGGGYRRIPGYERFDGRVDTPSSATYWTLAFDAGGPRQIVNGDIIVGVTSGKTAHVVGDALLESGDWADNDAAGIIGITAPDGDFEAGEILQILGVDACTAADVQQVKSIGDTNYKSWLGGARDYYRSLIEAVPGGGPIRGVVMYQGKVYALRDDAADAPSNCILYVSSTSGWDEVVLSDYLEYENGTVEVLEGDVITGASSGAVAVVERVNIAAGNITGPTFCSGRFALSGVVGGPFTDGEDLEVSAIKVAEAVSTGGTSELLPSGRYRFIVKNFLGADNEERIYAVDGVNRAWEFDGTTFCFIGTGMVTDAPTRVEEHKNHLFLAFPGGSLQNSSTGLPLVWSVRSGADEIGIGDEITDIRSNGNNQLAVMGESSMNVLFGTSDQDWDLKPVTDSLGALSHTVQEVGGMTTFLDTASVNFLTSDASGNLRPQPISRNVRKTIEEKATLIVDTIYDRRNTQYRLLFSDKTALVATFFGTKLMGWMPMLYAHQFVCSWSGTDADSQIKMFAGTDDGYVMQLDTGASFDGEEIESILALPYNYLRSPDRDKRFHKLTLEVDTPRAIDIRVLTDFDYGGGGQSETINTRTNPTGGIWDVSQWDEFFWDSAIISAPEANITGVGRNIGITLYHRDAVDDSFGAQAALLQYTMLGMKR